MSRAVGAVLIFTQDGGDVMAFASAAAAVGWLEAIDVAAGEYVAFALDGQVVDLRSVGDDVVLVGGGRWELDGLRARLHDYSRRVVLDCDPDDPVAVTNELLRRDWEARRPKWPRWLAARMRGPAPATVFPPESIP